LNSVASLGVVVLTPWYGGDGGGVAVITEALVHAMVGEGIRCTVIEVVGDGWRPSIRYGGAGEPIISLCARGASANASFPTRAAAAVRARIARGVFRRLVQEDGYSVAHFHYALPEYQGLGAAAHDAGLRLITTFHGSDLSINMDIPETRRATEHLLETVACATTVSRALCKDLIALFPSIGTRTRVIHNPIPPSFVHAVAKRSTETERDVDVLFVGNLIHRKGVDVLLNALASLRHLPYDQAPPRVVIVGDGAERPALETLATTLGIGDIVTFQGRQGREVLPGWYSRAKVVVVPSRAEPLGVVALEAQLSGACVIASDVGGLPEIVADGVNGALVPPDDPAALAKTLYALLTEPTMRSRLAATAMETVARDFSPSGIVRQYLSIYRPAS